MADAALMRAFLEHRRALARFAGNLGAEGEDVVQELWIRIGTAPGRDIHNVKAYLFRMVYHLVLDGRRGHGRRVEREALWHEANGAEDDRLDPHRHVSARDEVRRVDEVLTALGDPAATLFRRHRIDGVTQAVLAKEHSLGLSTVEKHLRRAYAALLQDERP